MNPAAASLDVPHRGSGAQVVESYSNRADSIQGNGHRIADHGGIGQALSNHPTTAGHRATGKHAHGHGKLKGHLDGGVRRGRMRRVKQESPTHSRPWSPLSATVCSPTHQAVGDLQLLSASRRRGAGTSRLSFSRRGVGTYTVIHAPMPPFRETRRDSDPDRGASERRPRRERGGEWCVDWRPGRSDNVGRAAEPVACRETAWPSRPNAL